SFVGILAASVVYYFCKHFLQLAPAGIFFWAAVGTVGALAYVLWLLPDSLLRLLLWIAANTIYRLDLKGQENIPARGGALLTPNHASWVDAVLLIAATDRHPLPDVQGRLRPPGDQAVRQNAEDYSHCFRSGAA